MAEQDEEIVKELKQLANMAKRLKLTGRKAEQYVREHMEQLGYEAHNNVTYSRKEPSGGKGSGFLGGIFGGGSSDDDDEL